MDSQAGLLNVLISLCGERTCKTIGFIFDAQYLAGSIYREIEFVRVVRSRYLVSLYI